MGGRSVPEFVESGKEAGLLVIRRVPRQRLVDPGYLDKSGSGLERRDIIRESPLVPISTSFFSRPTRRRSPSPATPQL